MKHIKRIIIVLLLTLAFAFTASATETYRETFRSFLQKRFSKSDRKGYVGGTNSAATSGSQSATPSGAKHTAEQYKHHNYTNKIQ
jgi:hypothetical protein